MEQGRRRAGEMTHGPTSLIQNPEPAHQVTNLPMVEVDDKGFRKLDCGNQSQVPRDSKKETILLLRLPFQRNTVHVLNLDSDVQSISLTEETLNPVSRSTSFVVQKPS
ncbi:hypothetical protein LWI28_002835 [Acer negundo]|uniref:Uncharacterized protein n=1 Tax=Acer negundo TaxID=4023 RepID=A0AAD5NIM1_ACENE|nr:hypothetical protein LWI28_002835 [Acer negundo]